MDQAQGQRRLARTGAAAEEQDTFTSNKSSRVDGKFKIAPLENLGQQLALQHRGKFVGGARQNPVPIPEQVDAVSMLNQLERNVGNSSPDLEVFQNGRRRKRVRCRVDDADTTACDRHNLVHLALGRGGKTAWRDLDQTQAVPLPKRSLHVRDRLMPFDTATNDLGRDDFK